MTEDLSFELERLRMVVFMHQHDGKSFPSALVSLAANEVETSVKFCFRHSRESGNPVLPGAWIPAFAGMTRLLEFLVQRGCAASLGSLATSGS